VSESIKISPTKFLLKVSKNERHSLLTAAHLKLAFSCGRWWPYPCAL